MNKELKKQLPCLYGQYNLFGDKKLSFPRADRFIDKIPEIEKEKN
jgi:hypothetical protein